MLPVSFAEVTDFRGRNTGELYIFPGTLYFVPTTKDRGCLLEVAEILGYGSLEILPSSFAPLVPLSFGVSAAIVALWGFKRAKERARYFADGNPEVQRELDRHVESERDAARTSGDYNQLLSSAVKITKESIRSISVTLFGTLLVQAGGPQHNFRVGLALKPLLLQALTDAGFGYRSATSLFPINRLIG